MNKQIPISDLSPSTSETQRVFTPGLSNSRVIESDVAREQKNVARQTVAITDTAAWDKVLEQSSPFHSLKEVEKQQVYRIIDSAIGSDTSKTDVVLQQIIKLLNRRNFDGELLIHQRDRRSVEEGYIGKSMLELLYALANADSLHGELKQHLPRLLRDTLDDICDQREIDGVGIAVTGVNQIKKNATCVPTSGDLGLVASKPVEYVRQLVDLATTGASTVRFARENVAGPLVIHFRDQSVEVGDTIHFDTHSIESAIKGDESLSEALIQSAYMKYCGAGSSGVFQGQAEAILEAQFGTPFMRIDADSPEKKALALQPILQAKAPGNDEVVIASVRWERSGKHENHAVLVVGAKDGMVYFQNPWSKDFVNPDSINATLVDRDARLYKMDQNEFSKLLNYALVSGIPEATFGLTAGYDERLVETTRYFGIDVPVLDPDLGKRKRASDAKAKEDTRDQRMDVKQRSIEVLQPVEVESKRREESSDNRPRHERIRKVKTVSAQKSTWDSNIEVDVEELV